MIIYSFQNAIKRLQNSEHQLVDGSIKVYTGLFFSIVHSKWKNLKEKDIPYLCMLLPKKRQETYDAF